MHRSSDGGGQLAITLGFRGVLPNNRFDVSNGSQQGIGYGNQHLVLAMGGSGAFANPGEADYKDHFIYTEINARRTVSLMARYRA